MTETHDKGAGLDPDGNPAKVVFDEATKTWLQKAAYDTVVEFGYNANQ